MKLQNFRKEERSFFLENSKTYVSDFIFQSEDAKLRELLKVKLIYDIHTQIQLFVMKTAIVWHLIKMFDNEVWKKHFRVWQKFNSPLGPKKSNSKIVMTPLSVLTSHSLSV